MALQIRLRDAAARRPTHFFVHSPDEDNRNSGPDLVAARVRHDLPADFHGWASATGGPVPDLDGDSIGRWDEDTFVVTTSGLTDGSWLDTRASPYGSAGPHERFRRIDIGHMDVEVTYTDPATFKTPLTITQRLRLLPDQELIESFCTDNERIGSIIPRRSDPKSHLMTPLLLSGLLAPTMV